MGNTPKPFAVIADIVGEALASDVCKALSAAGYVVAPQRTTPAMERAYAHAYEQMMCAAPPVQIPKPMSAKILGAQGGLARAKSLTADRRSEIARKAARVRWSK